MPAAVRAAAGAAPQPARTQSMPLSAQLHRNSMPLSLSSRSSSEATKLNFDSYLQRARSMPPPLTTVPSGAAVAAAEKPGGSVVDSAVNALLRQALAPRAPPRQKRVRRVHHLWLHDAGGIVA